MDTFCILFLGSLPLSTNQNDSLAEIRVSTADKMAFHVKLKFGSDSTADSVLELTLARLDIELELGKEIFALWIVSNNLELQLTPTHKPVKLVCYLLLTICCLQFCCLQFCYL